MGLLDIYPQFLWYNYDIPSHFGFDSTSHPVVRRVTGPPLICFPHLLGITQEILFIHRAEINYHANELPKVTDIGIKLNFSEDGENDYNFY